MHAVSKYKIYIYFSLVPSLPQVIVCFRISRKIYIMCFLITKSNAYVYSFDRYVLNKFHLIKLVTFKDQYGLQFLTSSFMISVLTVSIRSTKSVTVWFTYKQRDKLNIHIAFYKLTIPLKTCFNAQKQKKFQFSFYFNHQSIHPCLFNDLHIHKKPIDASFQFQPNLKTYL